ncbi:Pentatricopeptide repeat [Parasponia andersonii]|uniref:Pentatricopeptide repeat n=1 Tax=Parasponia andersonii TaxID=3476 RepID=A0A2P5DR05_PARAD|nr:Pentatricopeptide repeat [Parasponia andersonii]
MELGFQVLAHLIFCGVELCEHLDSQLLELYCKLGCVEVSSKLFEKMSERNVLSWTSMMDMYYGLGDYKEAVTLYYVMIDEGIRPDHFVFPKVFKACSELKDYRAGKDVYDYIYDYMSCIGFEGNASVKRSFLQTFANCGRTDIARPVTPDQVTWNSVIAGYVQNGQLIETFKYLKELSDAEDYIPNVVSWTALITGYEKNGYSSEALHLLRSMLIKRVRPNSITISSVISACLLLNMAKRSMAIV